VAAVEVTRVVAHQFQEEVEHPVAEVLITITVTVPAVEQQVKETQAEMVCLLIQTLTEAVVEEEVSPKQEEIILTHQAVEEEAETVLLTIGTTVQHVTMPAEAEDPVTADPVQQVMAA
jgi:hypothetical protein